MDLYNVGSLVFAASYYCPFALICGLTRVSVRVCNIAVDPRVLGVLQIKWYQSQHYIDHAERNIEKLLVCDQQKKSSC